MHCFNVFVRILALSSFSLFFFSNLAKGQPQALQQKGLEAYKQGALKEAMDNLEKAASQFEEKKAISQQSNTIFQRLTIKLESPADTNYQALIDQLKSLSTRSDSPLPAFLSKISQAEAYIDHYEEKKALKELDQASALYDKELKEAYPAYNIRLYKDFIRALKGLKKFAETEKYYQKGVEFIENRDFDDPKNVGLFYWSYGDILQETGKFDSGMVLLKKGFSHLNKQFPKDHIVHTPVYNDIASTYKNIQTNDSALFYYNLGIKALRANNMIKTKQGGIFFMNRGIVYKHMNMHHLALRHFQKSRSIYKEVLPPVHPEKIYIYLNLASISNQLNNHQDALHYNEKAQKQIEKQPNPAKYKNLKAVALFTLGDTHLQLANHDKGIEVYKETVKILKEIYNPTYLSLGSCYFILAELYYEKGAYEKALEYTDKGTKIYKEKRGPKHPSIAQYSHIKKAKISQQLHKPQKTMEALQKAFKINATYFEPNSNTANPKAASIIDKDIGYLTAAWKAKLQNNLFDSSRDLKHLKTAYLACQLADTLLQNKIQNIGLQEDKSFFVKQADDFYPVGLDIIYRMLQHQPQRSQNREAYMEKAYTFAENDKATMLTSALSGRKILSTNKLPDSLTQKAQNIQQKVNQLNDQLSNMEDSSKIIKLQGERLDLMEEKKQLYNQIEHQNPKFYQLLTQKSQTPLKELQSQLKEERKNLIQFVGKEKLKYALVVTPEQTSLHQLPVTNSLQAKVLRFRNQMINGNHEFDGDLAHELYEMLFEPFQKALTSEQIVIVPDGIIGYLPFSTLLQSKPANNQIKNQNYLIRDFGFTYSPSASLWNFETKKTKKQAPENQYIGFAPSIKNREAEQSQIASKDTIRGVLKELPNAKKEIRNTLKFMDGHTYIGAQASESQFKQNASRSKILHLATHGILDDDRPAYNRLLFSQNDTSSEDGVLHTYELYELELNADLAILSACNTGYGTLKKGEGVMSLSRGFKIAGCKNILMTLWSVDDRASAELIDGFYKHLHQGKSKTEALRKAKLDYLDANDNMNANPYYWGGHVIMESKSNLNIQSSTNTYAWWLISGGLILAIATGTGLYSYKKQTKNRA